MRSRWRLGSRLLLATLAALVSMLSTAHAEAAPPAQAVAEHYTRPVLIDNFTANSIGKNWFAFNRDGGRQLPPVSSAPVKLTSPTGC